MGISSVNNNQMAFTGTVNKNMGTVNKNMGNGEAKKPSKAKIAAGTAVVAGTVVLGAGLASGKVKPADIQAFIQKAGGNILNAVKHPKTTIQNLPNKLWGLTVDTIGNGAVAALKVKNAVVDKAQLALEYVKIIGSSIMDVFGKK
ncbi:MAG: hypothetical protein OSJ27_08365 [Candidatus Gastranaerophilales bacterium]|nr:hypothetical protein [Candidatus Gastranaerophilales bacterium]